MWKYVQKYPGHIQETIREWTEMCCRVPGCSITPENCVKSYCIYHVFQIAFALKTSIQTIVRHSLKLMGETTYETVPGEWDNAHSTRHDKDWIWITVTWCSACGISMIPLYFRYTTAIITP